MAKVAIIDQTSGKKYHVQLPTNIKTAQVLPALIKQLKLPSEDSSGRRLEYDLTLESESGKVRLGNDELLEEAGVTDGATLRITPQMRAGCFLGNVRISLANGNSKPISDIQVGDVIVSGRPDSLTRSSATVAKVFKDVSNTYLTINKSLLITDSHPVCSNGKWVAASRLKIGDYLQDICNNKIVIESIERKHGNFEVYNLYVSSPEHTFYAEGSLVHNMAFKESMALPNTSATEEYVKSDVTSTDISNDVLSIRISLATSVTLNEFFDNVTSRMQDIDFIYSIYSLLSSNDNEIINNFIDAIKQQGNQILSNTFVHRFMIIANVEPLRIQSIHYGSPATFDLLGVSNVLEVVRETIKDLAWRSEHEKALAKLELQTKQDEVQKNKIEAETRSRSRKLELEKAALELESQRLLIEKTNTELLSKKIELLSQMTNLQLTDDEKNAIISAILPKALTITNNPVTPLPRTADSYRLLFSRKEQ